MGSEDDANHLSPANPPSGDDTHEQDDPSEKEHDKITQIINACTKNPDVEQLIALSTAPGGLISDDVRKVACTFQIINTLQRGLHYI